MSRVAQLDQAQIGLHIENLFDHRQKARHQRTGNDRPDRNIARPFSSVDQMGVPSSVPTPSVVSAATAAAMKPTDNNLLRLRTRPSSKIAPAVAASMHDRIGQVRIPARSTLISVTAAESNKAISCS